jgi:hypothetical protein
MHIELVKMSQFFARPISNEDKKFVGLNKQVKAEIGLRILEEYGLAELVAIWSVLETHKNINSWSENGWFVASTAQSESGCSFAFIAGSFKRQAACSGHLFWLAAAAWTIRASDSI